MVPVGRNGTASSFTCAPSTHRGAEPLLQRLLAAIPDDPQGLPPLCAQVTDWSLLLQCARRHGLEGVIFHHLTALHHALPPELKTRAEQQRIFERLGQSRLCAALDQSLAALDGAGVRVVPLKGPVLGERLYPDPTARPSTDLDLLVLPGDLDRATSVLATFGYHPGTGPSDRYHRAHHHHISLYRPHWPTIELHFHAYTGFGTIVPAEPFLARAGAYRTTSGVMTTVLSPEDELLYLSLHAADHYFVRLAWLYDLKLLLRKHPELDWAAVVSRAKSLGVAGVLSITREMLRLRLDVALPDRHDLPPPRGLRWRAASGMIADAAARSDNRHLDSIRVLVFQALLCDHFASAARIVRHHLARIARRRAQRYFPRVVPEDWAG